MRTILSCLLITHFLHIINNCAEQEFDIIQSFDKYLLMLSLCLAVYFSADNAPSTNELSDYLQDRQVNNPNVVQGVNTVEV